MTIPAKPTEQIEETKTIQLGTKKKV